MSLASRITRRLTDHDGACDTTLHLVPALRSDTGPVRRVNQDRVRCLFDGNGDRLLLTVADGMGGHQGGEVASLLATDGLAGAFRSAGDAAARHWLDAGLRAANRVVRRAAATRADWLGMGTTLSALLVERGRFVAASVGDSRVYLLRGGRLQALSVDDTLVGQLAREGRLDADAAARHPDRHLLTRALGSEEWLAGEVVCAEGVALPGDRFLLCSDGVHDVIDDPTLAHLLGRGGVHDAADRLIAQALAAGTTDNVSAIVLDVRAPADPAPVTLRHTRTDLASVR